MHVTLRVVTMLPLEHHCDRFTLMTEWFFWVETLLDSER